MSIDNMKVLLIDVDSKIPNLALMKIASWHRTQGDTVGWTVENPDKIYASIVFTKNCHKLDGLALMYPNAEIDIGGSGYDIKKKLPPWIEEIKPDYSIYPDNDFSLGYTTRGCIRDCYFCIVREKEGSLKKVAHPGFIHDPAFGKIMFLDNNIVALNGGEWFLYVCEYCRDHNLLVDFSSGIDIRLMTPEIAAAIVKTKTFRPWKFAFDQTADQEAIVNGIKMLQIAGGHNFTHSSCLFYVYLHDDAAFDDAYHRCMILKENNASAYVMINPQNKRTQRMTDLKRYCMPQLFWSIDYEDYKKKNRSKNASLYDF